jgi:hypothetical protein
MDPELSANIEDGKMKIRHNPGIMRLKTVKTPTRLENAVNVLFILVCNNYENIFGWWCCSRSIIGHC